MVLRPHRHGRLRALVVGVLLLVLGIAFGPAAPAFAHSELLSSDPAAGAVLTAAPSEVTLTFNEAVEIGLGAIRLFDGTGARVDIPESSHPSGHDEQVVVALPALKPGSYVVSWKAVSADSHPVSGAFTFQVGATATLGTDVVAQVTKDAGTNPTADFVLGIARSLVIAAIVVVGGILAAWAAGVVAPIPRTRRLVLIGAVVGAVAGIAEIPLEAAYVSGRSLSTITDSSAWRTVLDTRIGTAWLLRAILLGVGGALLWWRSSAHPAGWWRAAVGLMLVGAGLASAYSGHGATGRWIGVGVAGTVVHVAAMAVWLGGLVVLLVDDGSVTADGARRFSAVALVAATAVVLTGVLQAWRQLGSLSSLFDNDYGRLLLAKTFAVVVVLGFAAASRRAVHGRLRVGGGVAASVGAAGDLDRATLRRSVGAEVLFGVSIVMLTASLMGANPRALAAPKAFSATLVEQNYLASVVVNPAGVGLDEIHIYLSSPGGSLTKPDSVTMSISDASRAIAPIGINLVAAGADHFQSTDARFPYPGKWTMTIRAVYNTFDEIVFTTDVTVR